MMHLIFLLTPLLFHISKTSIIVHPPLLHKIKTAGAIISGRLHKIKDDHIVLKQVYFLKGCGPRTVAIKGLERDFRQFKLDLKINKNFRILVFACQESENRRWWQSSLKELLPQSFEGEIRRGLAHLDICLNCCSFLKMCRRNESWKEEQGALVDGQVEVGFGLSI